MSEKYYYAVTRTAELENRLLSAQRVQSMAEAADAAAVLKLLAGTVYAESAERLASPADFERMLSEQTRMTFDYIREVSPDPGLAELYLIAYDVANLKVLIKAEQLGENHDSLLTELGSQSLAQLKTAFSEEDLAGCGYPAELDEAVAEIRRRLADGAPIRTADLLLDAAQFALMRRIAASSHSAFIRGYVAVCIDLANLRDFLRIGDGGKAAFYPVFLPGGNLTETFFDPYFGDGLRGFPDGLTQTDYAPLAPAAEAFLAGGGPAAFEKACDDFLTGFIRASGNVAFGPERLMAFIAARQIEIAQLRIILVGKVNGIAVDVIQNSLRELY